MASLCPKGRRYGKQENHANGSWPGFCGQSRHSFLVIIASKRGVPVSTTHVSCGALFGIGIANGKARWAVIRSIVLAWVLILPVAALLAGGIFMVLQDLVGKDDSGGKFK